MTKSDLGSVVGCFFLCYFFGHIYHERTYPHLTFSVCLCEDIYTPLPLGGVTCKSDWPVLIGYLLFQTE